jgi:hypothetical protein
MADVFERTPAVVLPAGSKFAISGAAAHGTRLYVGGEDGSLRVMVCREGEHCAAGARGGVDWGARAML